MRVADVVQRARLSTSGEAVVRIGLASRSIVYATLSVLVLQLRLRQSSLLPLRDGGYVSGDLSGGRHWLRLAVSDAGRRRRSG